MLDDISSLTSIEAETVEVRRRVVWSLDNPLNWVFHYLGSLIRALQVPLVQTWIYVGCLVGAEVLLLKFVVVFEPGGQGFAPFPLVGIAAGICLGKYLAIQHYKVGSQEMNFNVAPIFWMVGVVSDPTGGLLLAALVGLVLGSFFPRAETVRSAFNVINPLLIGTLVVIFFQRFFGSQPTLSGFQLAGCFICSVGVNFFLGWTPILAIALYARQFDFHNAFTTWFSYQLTQESALASLGVLAIICLKVAPVGLLFLGMWLFWLSYSSRAVSREKQQSHRLVELQKITDQLLIATQLHQATKAFVESSSQLLSADFIELYLYKESALLQHTGEELHFIPVRKVILQNGLGVEEFSPDRLLPIERGLIRCLEGESPLNLNKEATHDLSITAFNDASGLRNGVAALIGDGTNSRGFIVAGNFTSSDRGQIPISLLLMRNLAAQTNLALDRSRLADSVEQAAREHEKLLKRLLSDSLTKVGNRDLFLDRLREAFAQVQDEPERLGVVFLDLDGFKTVNDTVGHAAGDEVLRVVGQRLLHLLRPHDTVARFGGDEFAVLLRKLPSDKVAQDVAQRIVEILRREIHTQDVQVQVRASAGLITTTTGAEGVEEIIRMADMAMYEAKRRGKDQVFFGDPSRALLVPSAE